MTRLVDEIISDHAEAGPALHSGIASVAAAIEIVSPRRQHPCIHKPHRSCYALVEPALGVPKNEVLFVSSNSFDVAGAKAFGFEVAWIRRGGGGAPANMFRPAPNESGPSSSATTTASDAAVTTQRNMWKHRTELGYAAL